MKELIKDYLAETYMCLELFRKQFGRSDVLKALAEHVIPRRGKLNNANYQIHGMGCQVEFEDHFIEFEFIGPEGRVGFDSWRLLLFSEQYPARYPHLQDKYALELELNLLLSEGFIRKASGLNELFVLN